jgi:hypothetical protein
MLKVLVLQKIPRLERRGHRATNRRSVELHEFFEPPIRR